METSFIVHCCGLNCVREWAEIYGGAPPSDVTQLCDYPPLPLFVQLDHPIKSYRQIGRASCRERV